MDNKELILRVAHAIDDAMRKDPYMPDVAKAAILALREPTQSMEDAADSGPIPAEVVWEAMIDDLLKTEF